MSSVINLIAVIFGLMVALFIGYDMGFQDAKKKFANKENK